MIDGRLDMEEINTAFGASAVSDEDKAMAESIQEEVK
jgi:hypothetical protein